MRENMEDDYAMHTLTNRHMNSVQNVSFLYFLFPLFIWNVLLLG